MKPDIDTIEAVILAGGKSSRIGENKALLKINGKTIIGILAERLQKIFPKVSVSTNSPGDFTFLNLPLFQDVIKNMGPLSGIHAGLNFAEKPRVFFISCDMPLVSDECISFLTGYETQKSAVIPFADGYEQRLCAIYDKPLSKKAEVFLKNAAEESATGMKIPAAGMKNFTRELDAEIIDVTTRDFYHRNLFFNLNNPDDYSQLLEIIAERREEGVDKSL